jgi:hypothetical protein
MGAASTPRVDSDARAWDSRGCSDMGSGAKAARLGSSLRASSVCLGAGGGEEATGVPVRPSLWRPRPPRRPRRLWRRPGGGVAACDGGAAASTAGCSTACSYPAPFVLAEGCAISSPVNSALGNSAPVKSGAMGAGARAGSVSVSAAAVDAGGIGAPKRASASSAFFFHCARRKRSAAAVYQRAASACVPDFSCRRASSNATIASRVCSKRSAS